MRPPDAASVPPLVNLALSGTGACIATACIHPLDVARIRAQVSAEGGHGWASSLVRAVRTEGISAAYSGLSAGLLRQVFYGTSRFGFFQIFQDALRSRRGAGEALGSAENALSALGAGAIAGIVGNPADVALTRMASDARSEPAKRRGYRNGAHALVRIAREEGVRRGLMVGVGPNVARALVINGVMLFSYAETKARVARATGLDGLPLQVVAGNVAGFNTALLGVPADVVKTKLQYARPGEPSTVWAVVSSLARSRGLAGFFAGFVPLWLKLAPHTTITMVVIERLRSAYAGLP